MSAIAIVFAGVRVSAQSVELVSLTNLWRYEGSGADLGVAWKEVLYNDSAWPEGRGLLATQSANEIVEELSQTTLTRIGTNGYKLTDYSRTRFTVPAVRAGWFLIALNLVDDGAVFYLNGSEWIRFNMPTGTVNAATLAAQTIGEGQEGMFAVTNLDASGLVAGENLIAVEVHQNSRVSADVVFGAELVLVFPANPSAHVGPALQFQRTDGRLALVWDAFDFALEQASSPTGSWQRIPWPALPHIVSPAQGPQFFRLARP